MNIVLLGPPGAGKGTQAQFICKDYGIRQVATGDMFREARQKQTELGKKVESYMLAGKLVPDDVVIEVVGERLWQSDCEKGFLLDGFPRTVAQADALEKRLVKRNKRIDAVLSFLVPDDVIVKRLSGRRVCGSCGANYHVDFAPSQKEKVCDRCGGEIIQRKDDTEKTIKERLKVYKDQTQPLVEYYQKRGLLQAIDGQGEVSDIRARVRSHLETIL